MLTTSCTSHDVVKQTNANGYPVFYMKGDKKLQYPPAGTWNHDPGKRSIMTNEENSLLKNTITNSFKEKRFNKLKTSDIKISLSIWVDSLGQVISTEYKVLNKNNPVINEKDIKVLDQNVKKLVIAIPPAYESYKFYKHEYFYIFNKNEIK